MDIITHTMMGMVFAAPMLERHPLVATALAVGCVLPDLDAFSRTFGRRAFLRWHQTYSHSFFSIALTSLALWGLLHAIGLPDVLEPQIPYAALALGMGQLSHVLTDASNTYGVTLLAPFSNRRICTEWVFFIDAFVITCSLTALGGYVYLGTRGQPLPAWIAIAYGITLLAYWLVKALMRRRAGQLAPKGTLSLLPSALFPHRFLGCAREDDQAQVLTFEVDALRGQTLGAPESIAILDEGLREQLSLLPEYRTMLSLTPAYHVVERSPRQDGSVFVICRDLRTRNFKTNFGQLDLVLDPQGKPSVETFHV